jgi:hypothetical protein
LLINIIEGAVLVDFTLDLSTGYTPDPANALPMDCTVTESIQAYLKNLCKHLLHHSLANMCNSECVNSMCPIKLQRFEKAHIMWLCGVGWKAK